MIPLVVPNSILVYYKDEDNNGVDDESGLELEEAFSTLYSNYKDYGIDTLYFYSDDQRRLAEIENDLSKKSVPLEASSYESTQDLIQSSLKMNRRHIKEINQNFADSNIRTQGKFEGNLEEFEKQLSPLIKHAKLFYGLEKDNLSPRALILGAEMFDESNDLFTRWKLVHAFESEYEI